MVLKLLTESLRCNWSFENDVKMYGTQTHTGLNSRTCLFENDVKMYGTQTGLDNIGVINEFENDVKMYGNSNSPVAVTRKHAEVVNVS